MTPNTALSFWVNWVQDPSVWVVSDIDFTLCIPAPHPSPFYPDCLTTDTSQCPLVKAHRPFPGHGRCIGDISDLPLVMSCPHRDAFSQPFYDWMATLDFEHDTPIQTTVHLMMASPNPVRLLSNRHDACESGTRAFLSHLPITVSDIYLRKSGDLRPLWAFKLETIAELATYLPRILWIDDQMPPHTPPNVTWIHPHSLGNP